MAKKIKQWIDIPQKLNVQKHIMQGNSYTLYGIISHVGDSLTDGHYVTYIHTDFEEWWRFHDSEVKPATFDHIKNLEQESPYLIIYVSEDMAVKTDSIPVLPLPVPPPVETIASPKKVIPVWPICKNCYETNDRRLFSRRWKFCGVENG